MILLVTFFVKDCRGFLLAFYRVSLKMISGPDRWNSRNRTFPWFGRGVVNSRTLGRTSSLRPRWLSGILVRLILVRYYEEFSYSVPGLYALLVK